MTVFTNWLTTLHNIFPIKFAGITLLNWKDLEDYDDSGASVLCYCKLPTFPYLRVGFPLHFWEPALAVETVQQPWCSPTLGSALSLSINKNQIGDESSPATQNNRTASAQAHLVQYPIWWFLGLFVDMICFQTTGLDYLYMTELDPLYQNDLWASILAPEGNLFTSKVAKTMCIADCAAATVGYPINYLFWCQGCWGGSYPLSRNAQSVDYMQANAEIAAKFIYKMHREAVLWLTSGPQMIRGYCTAYPWPMMKKTQYNLLMLYPYKNTNRQPIGRSAMLWGMGKNNVFNPNYVWGAYRVRDCCAF